MKENLFPTPEPEELVTIAKDVDADDPEASDLLDVIGRDTSVEEQPEEPTKAVTRAAVSGGPFMLESLYFRSFGERALLTREEEIELAKKIDHGTTAIRKALRHAIRILPRLKRSDSVLEAQRTLQMVRGLSGLSATALDKAEQSLTEIFKQGTGATENSHYHRQTAKGRVGDSPLCADRARTGKGRIGALQPAARRGCRKTLHGPWPDFTGSRARRKYRFDESGRALSISQGVQVQHLCNVVDPSRHHARAGGSIADHSHSGSPD